MWIKILLLVAIVAIAAILTRATAGARRQALRRLLLAGFITVAALSVIFPNALTRVANWMGVGRGADLLLYALVIAFVSYVGTSYRRTSHLNRQLTVLAREVALLHAEIDPRNQTGDLHNSSTSQAQGLRRSADQKQYDSES
ncbi:hypothetical protein GCM10010401_03710 [Rarobacter faecitabidus]|uniref:DUF2304 domain-containing protein n=1 Tax=Rarobacter faecitabidus TaxID=13243 RepID=A0A542ZU41_RARFA|nr:DUF2304 domain-containing protein [Rarobacter faecitabidus]TQL63873.1 hypothetical protein FB461_0352 [Rarobacter faecitabidus]